MAKSTHTGDRRQFLAEGLATVVGHGDTPPSAAKLAFLRAMQAPADREAA